MPDPLCQHASISHLQAGGWRRSNGETDTLTSLICSEVIGLFWVSIAPSDTMMIFSLFFRARF